LYAFERFDGGAKKVLTLAQEEAARANHSYIGTEHLLLGMVRAEAGAGGILTQLGVREAAVREAIERVLGRSTRIVIQQIVPTSRVKKVIELAFEVAQREGSSRVTTDHLLIGLLQEGNGVAAHVLHDLGATLEAVSGARASAPVTAVPWPRPGERVLLHDPEAPYRLWEGTVTAHHEGVVTVAVPDHPTRPEARVEAGALHRVPPIGTSSCERCGYREEVES
jgi:hypothetical protein